MPIDLKTILDDAVRMENYIKSRPLQARLFSLLCEEMGSEHRQLLLHTKFYWLSRGRVLTRLFQLRDEVRKFLIDSKFELADRLCDFDWLCKLAYLADIFSRGRPIYWSADISGRYLSFFYISALADISV